ncbi:MAG: undecaprenyl-diphosphate phosphatase [Fusobacteriaceae bacterium]
MDILLVIILGLVEGLTEFLPISSTGHMIIVDNILLQKFMSNTKLSENFMNTFLIVVQLGAIIAVVIYFWKEINPFVRDKKIFSEKISLWSKIIVGVIPIAIVGVLFDKKIEDYFIDNIYVIAGTLIFYGIILLFIEKKIKRKIIASKVSEITYPLAIAVGVFQCLAVIPGTSRSAATIIGALVLGFSRGVAAEFSFFIAIPTMAGATLLKLLKNSSGFSMNEWFLMGVGTFVAFLSGYFVIRWFMNYIRNKNFVFFGVYRIILGILVFVWLIQM